MLALLAPATELGGQAAQVGVFAGRTVDERGRSHAGVTMAPSVAWTAPLTAGGLRAQLTRFSSGALLQTGAGWGRLTLPIHGGIVATMDVEGSLTASDGGYRSATGGAAPRFRVQRGGLAAEAGPRVAIAGGGSATAAPMRPGLLGPRGGEPSETQLETGWDVAASVTRGALALRSGWGISQLGERRWEEATGSAALDLGGVLVGVTGGARFGALRERWAAGRVAARMTPRIALVLEGGRTPSSLIAGRAAGDHATVGISVTTGPAAPRGRPTLPPVVRHGERARISLHAAPGALVEIFADWNGWRGEKMQEVAPGKYQVEVRPAAGVHRFALRVNGGWRTPPGYEVEEDEFGGKRAVLRVLDEN
ncbi:MAG: glycogen-binding domain-containing protein [Gemmatimonadetes bacterium]|nr:glycogen-binding domain-containing protein [Gemmatimonadota bacterium]